ncbi:MAG: hypothetical protein Q8M98_09885 [Candidatus Cloacimonadaceae bacterium]|nr:hypothetical protein [Candidatus Cloacimonadaceae bacterium]
MTLQARLKATAAELIQLLAEAQKEHDAFVQERDARLLSTFESKAPDEAVRYAWLLCLASDSHPAREALCDQIEVATAGLKYLLLQYESSVQTSCKAGKITDTRCKNLLFSIDAVVAFELFENRSDISH